MLKIGVLGAGHLGKIHIKLIKELEKTFKLIGFYDTDIENTNQVKNQFKISSYDSIEELLEKVDCVVIVTPTISHFELASKAILMKKHVFIEKPITQTVEEANKLIELAEANKVTVQVGHVERFNPAFIEALPFFKNPKFIETHRLAQFNPRGTDVPVVLDLMIHDIDAILSVVKSKVKSISASGVAVISDTDDITNARIEFENGCVANLTSSRISLKNMRKSRFFQKDAYISVDFLNKELEVFRMENIEGDPSPFDIIFDLGKNTPRKKVLFDKPNINESNAIKEELFSFYEAIITNSTPRVSIYDATKALEVAIQIIDAIRSNKNS